MDKPAIEVCEAFAKAGYPLDVEALLIVEVEGSEEEIDDLLASIVAIAEAASSPKTHAGQSTARSESARDLERPQVGVRRHRAASPTTTAWTAPSRSGSLPDVLRRHLARSAPSTG